MGFDSHHLWRPFVAPPNSDNAKYSPKIASHTIRCTTSACLAHVHCLPAGFYTWIQNCSIKLWACILCNMDVEGGLPCSILYFSHHIRCPLCRQRHVVVQNSLTV